MNSALVPTRARIAGLTIAAILLVSGSRSGAQFAAPGDDLEVTGMNGRDELLHRYGGSEKTEAAVLKALRWLGGVQNPNGSWSKTQPDAMCGLALLAFLAHGETPDSAEFGTTVERAAEYLAGRMDATGQAGAGCCGGRAYTHAIVTLALAEFCVRCPTPQTKAMMEKGLDRIVRGQQGSGGWDYRYAKGKRWDLSVSGWQIQAMKVGHAAAAEVEGLENALRQAAAFVRDVTYKNGKFGYSTPGSGSWAMQGAGVYCLQLLGEGRSLQAATGVRNISERDPVVWRDDVPYRGHSNPTYNWYYEALALFHTGGDAWEGWNRTMTDALVPKQHGDGRWTCPGKDPDQGGREARPEYDPYYTTALCCLCLEVYYRYPRGGWSRGGGVEQ